jgi:ubiquinone/menaquinone biosynthesis C-methylase UbiE
MSDIQEGFREVDRAADRGFFFEFLDEANAEPSLQRYRRRMAELCPVEAGARVLDIGCGLGHEARRLAELAGRGGSVVGLDVSEEFVAEARRRTEGSALPLEFRVGDAHALEFPDGCFDLCRAERALLYMKEPQQVVREMARVLRPGGSAAVFDFDMAAFVIDSNHPVLSRRIERLLAEDAPNGLIGRALPHLFRQAGLTVRGVEPHAITPSYRMFKRIVSGTLDKARSRGELSESELQSWWNDLEELDNAGRFYTSHIGYIVVGGTNRDASSGRS